MESLDALGPAEEELRAFAAAHVAPHAARIDAEERIPAEVIAELAKRGMFASGFPSKLGGADDTDPVGASLRHGLMHEALGHASASVQGLVNVHHMAGSAIARWGSRAQKEEWVPKLTSGKGIPTTGARPITIIRLTVK